MPYRILIVGDNESQGYSIAKIIQEAGFEMVRSTSGQDALRSAITRKPDLVILDVHLPDIGGYEVARRLKTHPETGSIPIIFHSESEGADGAEAAASSGSAFLTYPIQRNHLLHVIRGTLARAAKAS